MIKISCTNDALLNPGLKILISLFCLTGIHSGLKAQDQEAIRTFKTDSNTIMDICLDASEESLVVADDKLIRVFDLEGQKLLRTLENGHSEKITSIDISSDNQYLISADIEKQIVLWDFESGKMLQKLDYHPGLIHDIAISPDNRYLLSGGTNSKVIVYDLEQKQVAQEFQDHKKNINVVAFSPDTSLMATAGTDKKVRIYSLPNFELLGSLKGHTNVIRDIGFNKESTKLISTGDDSHVIIWDLKDPQNIRIQRKSRKSSSWIFSIDFYNRDKINYVYGGLDGHARILTDFSQITWKADVPIHKIMLKPHKDSALEIIVATRGKGVVLIDLSRVKTQME